MKLTGAVETETSSLVEAHRINSPFIITDKQFQFDPNSLLHGAFMANLEDGRIKAPRAVTGFIEAEDVREAASGGVKNNPLDPTGKIRAVDYDKDVYGNVPYHRMEYTAAPDCLRS